MAKEKPIEILPPWENPQLFGHADAEQRFLAEWTRGTPHHAYLISGPKGIGKATFAYRLARFILQQGAISAPDEGPSLFGDAPAPTFGLDMDVNHPLFRRIAAGSHTDLLALKPAYDQKKHAEKNLITVDEARHVPEFLSLTPAESDWRVVIIDAADQLNHEAANALLKTLEEPPARAILFLVCHKPGGILSTIRSRCRNFALKPPPQEAFAQIVQTVAPHIETHDYASLYALSYGSPGLAITLAKHGGLKLYENWLDAMQPEADAETKQGLVDNATSTKSPEAWAMLMHDWQVAMHRLSVYPDYESAKPIFMQEAQSLQTIAAAVPYAVRQRWAAEARKLLWLTETYNLDKEYTLRLMLDPARLDAQFPVAA